MVKTSLLATVGAYIKESILIMVHFSAINKINQYLDLINKSYWNNVSIWS